MQIQPATHPSIVAAIRASTITTNFGARYPTVQDPSPMATNAREMVVPGDPSTNFRSSNTRLPPAEIRPLLARYLKKPVSNSAHAAGGESVPKPRKRNTLQSSTPCALSGTSPSNNPAHCPTVKQPRQAPHASFVTRPPEYPASIHPVLRRKCLTKHS